MPRPRLRSRDNPADRGAGVIEWALLTPILLIVILIAIQFAMIYHASHVAAAAAREGARVARETPGGGWEGLAQGKAQAAVTTLGPNLLKDVQIQPDGDAYSRSVTVSGLPPQVIPPFIFEVKRVEKTSEGPIECFRPDQDQAKDCEPEAAQ